MNDGCPGKVAGGMHNCRGCARSYNDGTISEHITNWEVAVGNGKKSLKFFVQAEELADEYEQTWRKDSVEIKSIKLTQYKEQVRSSVTTVAWWGTWRKMTDYLYKWGSTIDGLLKVHNIEVKWRMTTVIEVLDLWSNKWEQQPTNSNINTVYIGQCTKKIEQQMEKSLHFHRNQNVTEVVLYGDVPSPCKRCGHCIIGNEPYYM